MDFVHFIDSHENNIPARINRVQCFPSLQIQNTQQETNPGPGTKRMLDSEQLIAMRLGFPVKHDTFTYIKPFVDVYEPQPGDVIIGRVIQIYADRWMLYVNAPGPVVLKLDALNLPGLLRQRETADETNMRLFLDVNELIVVEMKQNNQVFTRNHLFGKLSHGILLQVPPRLITGKQHFGHIDDISVILGSNGTIWLGNRRFPSDNAAWDASSQDFTIDNLYLIRTIAEFIEQKIKDEQEINFTILREYFASQNRSVVVQ